MSISLLVFMLVLFGAFTTGTVVGFGTTILTVTFAVHLFPLDRVLPVVAILNLLLGSYIAIRHRAKTQWRLLIYRIFPPTVLGVPFGLALFNLRDVRWLALVYGLFVTILAAAQLWKERQPESQSMAPLSGFRRLALLWGGGLIHGLYATGGPLIVYATSRDISDKGAFRSTLAFLFWPLNVALIVDYAVLGLYDRSVGELCLLGAIPTFLGLLVGEWAHRRASNRAFKLGVWALLLVGGIILTVRAA